MATEDNCEKKFGRTIWDVLASMLSNRFALGVFLLLGIAALVLAARGQLKVGFGKAGWTFCLPCDKPAPASVPSMASSPWPASTTQINPAGRLASGPTASAAVPASTQAGRLKLADKHLIPVLASLLKVPIYTSRADAKKLVPVLKDDIQPNTEPSIVYEQTIFGVDGVSIREPLSADDITFQAGFSKVYNFEKNTGKDPDNPSLATRGNTSLSKIDSYCYGDNFEKFLTEIIDMFGTPSENENYPTKDSTADAWPIFTIGAKTYCTNDDKIGCKVLNMNSSSRVYIFNVSSDLRLTLFAIKTSAVRQVQRGAISIENQETSCVWAGSFIPKNSSAAEK